jgi:SAM-dependent methyltransferase
VRVPESARAAVRIARRALDVALVERRYDVPPPDQVPASSAVLSEYHKAYAPTPWRVLRHVLPPDEVSNTDVFLDFGCGAGRVLLQAGDRYPFRRLVGVEVMPELAAAGRALLERNKYRLDGRPWEIVTTDVVDYEVPDDVTVAYLFDPFTGPVFDAAIAALEESVDRRPRRVRLVYLVPVEIARLEGSNRVILVRRGTTGWLKTGGRYDYFVGDLMPRA